MMPKSNRQNINNNKNPKKELSASTNYCQNIQGGKDPLKLEYITNQMKERGIDISYCRKCGY
jgi:hypothetical protein